MDWCEFFGGYLAFVDCKVFLHFLHSSLDILQQDEYPGLGFILKGDLSHVSSKIYLRRSNRSWLHREIFSDLILQDMSSIVRYQKAIVNIQQHTFPVGRSNGFLAFTHPSIGVSKTQ